MRRLLILFLVMYWTTAIAQEKSELRLNLQLQPELTFHKQQYSQRWGDKSIKATYNIGLASSLQYNITDRIFVDLGIAYISRRMNAKVFLDQAKLPPPHYSETKELNTTEHLSYRTLQIPVTIGYTFINNPTNNWNFLAGVSANYLLNGKYKVGNTQYDASYKKGYWQGISFISGLGFDIRLPNNIILSNSIYYSFTNPVHSDSFLFSQDEKEIPLPHKYLRVSTGIKIPL